MKQQMWQWLAAVALLLLASAARIEPEEASASFHRGAVTRDERVVRGSARRGGDFSAMSAEEVTRLSRRWPDREGRRDDREVRYEREEEDTSRRIKSRDDLRTFERRAEHRRVDERRIDEERRVDERRIDEERRVQPERRVEEGRRIAERRQHTEDATRNTRVREGVTNDGTLVVTSRRSNAREGANVADKRQNRREEIRRTDDRRERSERREESRRVQSERRVEEGRRTRDIAERRQDAEDRSEERHRLQSASRRATRNTLVRDRTESDGRLSSTSERRNDREDANVAIKRQSRREEIRRTDDRRDGREQREHDESNASSRREREDDVRGTQNRRHEREERRVRIVDGGDRERNVSPRERRQEVRQESDAREERGAELDRATAPRVNGRQRLSRDLLERNIALESYRLERREPKSPQMGQQAAILQMTPSKDFNGYVVIGQGLLLAFLALKTLSGSDPKDKCGPLQSLVRMRESMKM